MIFILRTNDIILIYRNVCNVEGAANDIVCLQEVLEQSKWITRIP